jgi:helicase MOV-10
MSKRRYQMCPHNKSYNKNYVTQLLDNFRSHPAILQFSNVLFYDSLLRSKIQEPERSFGTKWKYLNNKKFPVLFHCIKTPSKIARGCTSSFNDGELKIVRFYVDLLLKIGVGGKKVEQEDIGIVSPYKAQLQNLQKDLKHVKGVEIGTAEYYQASLDYISSEGHDSNIVISYIKRVARRKSSSYQQ